jgi:hypothetical protein
VEERREKFMEELTDALYEHKHPSPIQHVPSVVTHLIKPDKSKSNLSLSIIPYLNKTENLQHLVIKVIN